jgi:6-pyruvoyltetrahydropterin/6-carboxytetrahydropterin synthase
VYTITKKFKFDAAHQLHGLPVGHKCAALHGHTYTVEVVVESETLDDRGFVRDYGELRDLGEHIQIYLDHHCLNEVGDKFGIEELVQPTAENIARYLYLWSVERWPDVAAVRVSETPQTSAEYRPRKDVVVD